MMLTILFIVLGVLIAGKATAGDGYPTSVAAKRWKPDRDWLRGAFCIHRHESVNWHLAYRDWAGNSSPYSGGMQFLQSTWLRAGGKGHAYQWSPREQLYRAFIIWKSGGGSWREWGTAGACGLR